MPNVTTITKFYCYNKDVRIDSTGPICDKIDQRIPILHTKTSFISAKNTIKNFA